MEDTIIKVDHVSMRFNLVPDPPAKIIPFIKNLLNYNYLLTQTSSILRYCCLLYLLYMSS